MFKLPEGFEVNQQIDMAERNYVIQKNDYLEIDVFTNKGERIIDPETTSTTGQGTGNVPASIADLSCGYQWNCEISYGR